MASVYTKPDDDNLGDRELATAREIFRYLYEKQTSTNPKRVADMCRRILTDRRTGHLITTGEQLRKLCGLTPSEWASFRRHQHGLAIDRELAVRQGLAITRALGDLEGSDHATAILARVRLHSDEYHDRLSGVQRAPETQLDTTRLVSLIDAIAGTTEPDQAQDIAPAGDDIYADSDTGIDE